MPETVQNPRIVGSSRERRVHPRVEVKSKVFADLGNGTFGAISNISDSGLTMRTAGPLPSEQIPNMCFRLTPVGKLIRLSAQVVWATVSTPVAGLQFRSMSAPDRAELTTWIQSELAHEGLDRANAYSAVQSAQEVEPTAQTAPPNQHDGQATLDRFTIPFAANQGSAVLGSAETTAELIANSGAPADVIQFPVPGFSADGDEKQSEPQSAELDRLKQLIVERTLEQKVGRKELQWAIAAVLSLLLVIIEIGLWQRVTRGALPTLGGPSTASDAIPVETGETATGPFQLKLVDRQNHQYVLHADGAPALDRTIASQTSDPASEKNSAEGAVPLARSGGNSRQSETSSGPGPFPASSLPFRCRGTAGNAITQSATVEGATTGSLDGMPVYTIEPTYPITDAQSCVEGTVRLHATIDRSGIVRNLKPVSGPPSLFNSAMNAARYWRFEPVLQDGQPTDAERDINVVFRNIVAETH